MGCGKKQSVLGKCRSEIKRTEPDAILYKAAFGFVLAVFPWGAVHFFTETFSKIGLLAEAGLQGDLSDGKCGFFQQNFRLFQTQIDQIMIWRCLHRLFEAPDGFRTADTCTFCQGIQGDFFRIMAFNKLQHFSHAD